MVSDQAWKFAAPNTTPSVLSCCPILPCLSSLPCVCMRVCVTQQGRGFLPPTHLASALYSSLPVQYMISSFSSTPRQIVPQATVE